MKSLLLIVLTLLIHPTFGQKKLNWNSGSVVLINNEVLVGDIVIHLDFNTLLLKSEDQLIVLPSYKIKFFRFYDQSENINRQFISMKELRNNSHLFYEVVVQGDFKVVRKLDKAHAKIPDNKTDYSYFVIHDDDLYPLRSFTKEVIPGLVSANSDLNQWVRLKRIDLHSVKNSILILKQYNHLNFDKQLMAVR